MKFGVIATMFWVCTAGMLSAAERERPNFIVINIDDLGYGDIGPYGATKHRTPNLDRMGKEGMKLASHYAAPVCSPSRASLMTGCYPKRALPIPHVLFPIDPHGLHPDEVTIAEILSEAGYTTGIIGKWHLGDQAEFLPLTQGFQHYFGLPYSNDMGPAADGIKSNLGAPLPKNPKKGQPPLPLMRDGRVVKRVMPDDQQAIVATYTDEAIKFIETHRDEPFFLYLPHTAVHFPLYPSDRFHNRSGNGLMGDWIEEVDWSVGQVLDCLRANQLEENTLVIFTSDNGGAPRFGSNNGPLRGGKGSTWEGGMRVPTLAWWPGKIPANSETMAITGMMDVLPTFVELAGTELPKDRKIDGGSIWPILSGGGQEASSPHSNFLYFRGLQLEAVREGQWKLHLKSGELYDLVADIGEQVNVAEANPEVVNRLKEIAMANEQDLGNQGIGPGCRTLGVVTNPQPLIAHDGSIRDDVK